MNFKTNRKTFLRAANFFAINLLMMAGLSTVSPTSANAAPSGVVGSIVLGSGNYFKTIDSSEFIMGASDFTFETWVHPTSRPSTDFTGIVSIGMPSDLTNGINGHEIRIGQSFAGDGKLGFMAPNDASNTDVWTATSSALALGEWTHLALVRNGSSISLYVNGVASATRTSVAFTHSGYPAKSGLGAFFISKNGGWGDGEFVGSVADIRLVKGTAVYTSNFTPPTSQLSAVGGSDTKVLMNTNYSSGNTVADFSYNSASGGLQVSAVGSPSSSSISPYQPLDTAMAFTRASSMSGASNSATAPLQNLNTYTVEGWVKPNAACIGSGIRCEVLSRDGDYDIAISDGTYRLVIYFNGTSNTGWLNTGVVPQSGAWSHVALTRNGTAVKFYLNAALLYSYTLSSAVASSYANFPFRIGYAGYGSTYFDGAIDEVRLWNTERSQAQVGGNLYSAPTLTDSTLLAYYDFNTGQGSTVVNRKVGAAATSFLALTNSPSWADVKIQTTGARGVTISIPRAYINTAGGLKLPDTVTGYDFLVVGGGGGGGNGHDNGGGGGGGGGMVRTGSNTITSGTIIAASVGVGGAGGANTRTSLSGSAGDSSSIGGITAQGGGSGSGSRSYPTGQRNGGLQQSGTSTAATGGSGGGAGGGGGGGGGSGSAGGNGSGATAGTAGDGTSVTIGSITAIYGAGGAGAPGSVDFAGAQGDANIGKGGGAGSGASSSSRAGGIGGTGIVIIFFATSSTATLSYSVGQPVYRTVGTITATASTAGKVTFYERGKVIPGCRNKVTNGSFIATCSWKPASHGAASILIVFVANSGSSANTSTTASFIVAKRTGLR